ncbi:putative 2-aminoethylphosphonate ABC transporter ATP-binding protein [Synechococcus sp. Nb3U1]|uniref:putative 2-aminoethylphosphonate ABC transporter ATP-binding protein n=1 Tax=Synechococcus sp. Nb3U1 TaxID=1914529 RepID=UPI001F2CC514|nr:putative 2-aminoethylphosphonate ABC transporter ATP-binding protein [Synechococcus sp. Nb3U1]
MQLQQIRKTFGRFTALSAIDLEVQRGEFICLLGPSGCGKTTLLRIIAGLEEPDSGRIWQAGQEITALPPSKRDFGIVFQSYALFPNLTAAQNIAYGLVNAGIPKAKREERVEELLALVGLSGSGPKYPAQLSGGQQQRIALARALALSPGLLLLDEPLSALDAQVRANLRGEIAQLQKRLGVTTVMVTHDQLEALTMADRIVVMDQGSIVQVGTPLEIYQNPLTPFVARFIGVMNFLPGVLEASGQARCRNYGLQVCNSRAVPVGSPVTLAIRPEDIRIDPSLSGNTLEAEVLRSEFLGAVYRLWLRVGEGLELILDLSVQEARQAQIQMDRPLSIQLPLEHIHLFEAQP